MSLSYIFYNDQFVKADRSIMTAHDLAIHRSYGVFDYFTYHLGENAYLDDYLDRFYQSVHGAHLNFPYRREELKELIHQLYLINKTELVNIKIIATAGYSLDGHTPHDSPNILLIAYPYQPSPSQKQSLPTYKLISYPYQRPFPHIKSTNYFCAMMLQPQLKAAGAIDVLYLDHGQVRETSRANIYLVKNGVVYTPSEFILSGITRKKILDQKEIEVITKNVSYEELITADEVFASSTTKGAIPIAQIDQNIISSGNTGPVTTRIAQLVLG